MKDFNDIDLTLCHSCGTCVAICPHSVLTMQNGLPRLTGECSKCGLCYESCPGIEFIYPEFNEQIFGLSDVDPEIGYFTSIYVGHTEDGRIRNKASSGGIVTALLLALLRKKEISGAVLVGMDKHQPWRAEAKIVTTESEIIDCAQSKYTMVSVNEVLKNLDRLKGDFALVGLPCHVHGIRKLQKLGSSKANRIKYSIGLFCGFNLKPEATQFLIRKFKVKNEQVRSLEYRGGRWPGGFLVKTTEGRNCFIPKHFYNYLNLMFVPRRCLLCPDFTNEFADLSVGDAWSGAPDEKGWSTIIVRTKKGEGVLKAVSGFIHLEPINKDEIKKGHAQLITYKKKGIFLRLNALSVSPIFDLPETYVSSKENIFNRIFLNLVYLMSSKPSIKLFEYIPITLAGYLAMGARNLINILFRPYGESKLLKKSNIFMRLSEEYRYLTIKEWNFPDIGNFWDSIVDYDEINKETHSYFRRFTDSYKIISFPENSYVLDICARTGKGTEFFLEKGRIKKVICADFSKRFQGICKQRLEKIGVRFETKLIESLPLPFEDAQFNMVFCFETVEHVHNPADFIKELGRVTRKDGQMILTTPNILWGPIHSSAAIFNVHHSEGPHRFISRGNLYKFLRNAGFTIIREKSTVLIPAGPRFLISLGEYLEHRLAEALMSIFGLRRILICKKL